MVVMLGLASEAPAGERPAANPTVRRRGPVLDVRPPAHDFGRITGGEIARHEFTFANAGDEALEILDVHTTCSCLEIGSWPKRLAPGQRGTVPVLLYSAAYSGRISESVTISCNDPARPEVTVTVTATIWRPLELTPMSAVMEFGSGYYSNASAVVHLTNNLAEPVSFMGIRSSSASVACEVRTNLPGREFDLVLRIVPPLPAGNIFGKVTLATSLTNVPRLELPFYALLQPDVTLTPPQLELPTGEVAERLSQTMWVRNFWTNALTLSSPEISDPAVAIQMREAEPGRAFELTLTYPAGYTIGQAGRIELKLKSNHPRFPVITVPIVQPNHPAATRAGVRP